MYIYDKLRGVNFFFEEEILNPKQYFLFFTINNFYTFLFINLLPTVAIYLF
jgi:hypothetical protein